MSARKAKSSHRVIARLKNTYLQQAVVISLALILGVLATFWLLNHWLVKKALEEEAEYYWQALSENPEMGMANSKNLKGFLLPRDQALIDINLDRLEPGYQSFRGFDGYNVAFVVKQSPQTMVLLFNRAEVDSLVFLFGVLPLLVVLLILYLFLWLSYRVSHRWMSPVIALAKQVKHMNLARPNKQVFDPESDDFQSNDETRILAKTIYDFISRTELFVDREKLFTRDVSHELRSPITVIKMAAELIQDQHPELTGNDNLKRITRAATDMEELTGFFLLLAREPDEMAREKAYCANDLVQQEVERMQLLNDKAVVISFYSGQRLMTTIPEQVIAVLISNLLRNAQMYTDTGTVKAEVFSDAIHITDTGSGISEQELTHIFDPFYRVDEFHRNGFGVGLAIVKRLCEQFSISINIESQTGAGTKIMLSFSDH